MRRLLAISCCVLLAVLLPVVGVAHVHDATAHPDEAGPFAGIHAHLLNSTTPHHHHGSGNHRHSGAHEHDHEYAHDAPVSEVDRHQAGQRCDAPLDSHYHEVIDVGSPLARTLEWFASAMPAAVPASYGLDPLRPRFASIEHASQEVRHPPGRLTRGRAPPV